MSIAFLGVLAAALLCTIWVGVRGAMAVGHLQSVAQISREVPAAFAGSDTELAPLAADLQREAAAAHSLTDDLVWTASEALPWVGPQLAAVGAIAESADLLTDQALPPLAEMVDGGGLDALAPQDGALPLDRIAALGEHLPAAVEAATTARESIDRVDARRLVGVLQGTYEDARGAVTQVASAIDALDNASRLLPSMLGQDGQRDYLLAFQNNAELRSLGGMPGSFAEVSADDGRITLGTQYSAGDFAVDEPIPGLSEELSELYQGPDRVISATTEIPDFAVVGELLHGYWSARKGSELDGVLSIDPVALSYLLEATGPVSLPGGDTLTSANAVDLLLNEVYLRYDPLQQNAYFAAATSAVFDAITEGRYEPATLVAALMKAGGERRLLVYSTHPDEQQTLADTTLSGPPPSSDEFGVYLNDGTGSKMGYYLRTDVTLVDSLARAGASELTLTLRSEAPDDAASLPASVTGGGGYGVPAGIARTVVYIYVPQGYDVSGLDAGGFTGFTRGTHGGHDVLVGYVDLAPGESATTRLTAGPTSPMNGRPTILVTPQAH
ncbi:DUF4012 domain-containing protein [Microbacterium marinilacus]|uniref:DUF4012 domain-containing protein n=1 Tax=Microbacterium marinilacus TaxID=415209 RepID=A0ABP7BDK9_9MICO|nr:DUF4012 domain-containing protein [Microbacterium marinilacus]